MLSMPERDSFSSPESEYPKIMNIVPCLQGKRKDWIKAARTPSPALW
jgi:hypothetical protein